MPSANAGGGGKWPHHCVDLIHRADDLVWQGSFDGDQARFDAPPGRSRTPLGNAIPDSHLDSVNASAKMLLSHGRATRQGEPCTRQLSPGGTLEMAANRPRLA